MMKQVYLKDFTEGPKIQEVPVPKAGPKDVLIKVECAPLMPLDRIFSSPGAFPAPYVFGAQASGTVIEKGAEVKEDCVGKKVQFGHSLIKLFHGTFLGTWTQYTVMPFSEVYIYEQSISHEQASAMYGNPLTAMGLVRKIMEHKPTCVVITPGASHISKIVTNLLRKDGIKTISIVRKEEVVKTLLGIGYEFVLNSTDPKFEEQFAALVKTHNATVLCDTLADDVCTKMFAAMPQKSMHLIYGTIGGAQTMTFPIFPLVMSDKTIKGYFWSAEDFAKPREEILKELAIVNLDLAKGGKIFGMPVVKSYKMEDFKTAIAEQPANASKGISVIKFH